jgi:hypothetical protein
MMPVPAQIWSVEGHNNEMARASRDHLITTRAEVVLGGLIRLDASDFELRVVGELHG